MNFIQKYWWIILIAIIVLAILWYAFGKKKEVPAAPVIAPGIFQGPFMDSTPGQMGACDKYFNSREELEAKIKLIEGQIGNTPGSSDWAQQVYAGIQDSSSKCGGLTFEQCRRISALYTLAQQGWCIPTSYK